MGEYLSTRREFSKALGLGLPIFLSNPRPFLEAVLSQTEAPRKASEVLGFVANPWVGGGSNPKETIKDAKNLGAKWLSVLEPSEEFLEEFARFQGSIQLLPRLYLPENRFDESHIDRELRKLRRFINGPLVVQPFNEVNLPDIETGGKYVSPFDHVNTDFIPTALKVREYGGIALLTPLAQDAEINDLEYLEDELKALVTNSHFREIINNIDFAVHNYITKPGAEQWVRVQIINSLVSKYVGRQLELHITETGLHQVGKEKFVERVVAKELKRMVSSEVPGDLGNLRSYHIWILASEAQEPANSHDPSLAKHFDPAALRRRRSRGGLTEAYIYQTNSSLQLLGRN